jgi:hypothetical protein
MGFSFFSFFKTLQTFPRAVNFIREHKVWDGFWNYSWAAVVLILASIAFSIHFYSSMMDLWKNLALTELGNGTSSWAGSLFETGQSFFFSSGFKYIIFILMQILVFHSVGRTIDIIKEEESPKPTFSIFIDAQIRVIKVAFQSWMKEIIATILLSLGIGALGFDAVKPVFAFLISCYFIGFTMLDNYNERLGMNIKESLQFTRGYIGVAIAVGLVVYVIMLVPVIGSFVGPMLGAVAAALAMHEILQHTEVEK